MASVCRVVGSMCRNVLLHTTKANVGMAPLLHQRLMSTGLGLSFLIAYNDGGSWWQADALNESETQTTLHSVAEESVTNHVASPQLYKKNPSGMVCCLEVDNYKPAIVWGDTAELLCQYCPSALPLPLVVFALRSKSVAVEGQFLRTFQSCVRACVCVHARVCVCVCLCDISSLPVSSTSLRLNFKCACSTSRLMFWQSTSHLDVRETETEWERKRDSLNS